MAQSLHEPLLPSWRMLALRGSVALLFGFLAALWPDITLLWLVVLFSAYALFGGAAALVSAVERRKVHDDWWLLLLLGLVGLGVGIVALVHPALTALILVLLMGSYALTTGVLDIAIAIRLRKRIRREWLLILNGLVSILFGALVFLFPASGALALVWLISAYALLTGMLLLSLAFRMRSWSRGGAATPGTPGRHDAGLAAGST